MSLKKKAKFSKSDILDEDYYLKFLDRIIERDFFPDLKHIRVKEKLLDARSRNDWEKMRDILRDNRYFNQKEDISLDESATQMLEIMDMLIPFKVDKEMGLDKFLSKHTSEDNASFKDIMDVTERRRRLQMDWCYKNDELPTSQSIQIEEKIASIKDTCNEKLALVAVETAIQPAAECGDRSTKSWPTYTIHNSVFFTPDCRELTALEKDHFKESKVVIQHESTRFKKPLPFSENRTLAANRKMQTMTKFGPDGKEISALNDDSQMHSIDSSVHDYKSFELVSSCPTPVPGSRELNDESPLMVWGKIDSTPLRLDPSSTPVRLDQDDFPKFKIQNISERELLAHKLADRVGKQNRAKLNHQMKEIQSHLKSPSSQLLSTLSPAAQRLLHFSSSSCRRMSSNGGGVGGGSSRRSFSTLFSPQSRHSNVNSPFASPFSSPLIKTKNRHSSKTAQISACSLELTANLLDLPATINDQSKS